MYLVSTFRVDNFSDEYGTSGLLHTRHGSLSKLKNVMDKHKILCRQVTFRSNEGFSLYIIPSYQKNDIKTIVKKLLLSVDLRPLNLLVSIEFDQLGETAINV